MTRRRGVTLMEVLVAITICGIGLLALMTLFPLGAMEMAQSVKDDRCGHIKHSAAAVANAFRIRRDSVIQAAMLNPGGGLTQYVTGNPAFDNNTSYPVFVDPIGYNANQGTANWSDWMGGMAGQTPRRVSYALLDPARSPDPDYNVNSTKPGGFAAYSKQQLYRWCVFLDEINFRTDDETSLGRACSPGSTVERTPRYSYAYLLQMPKVSAPRQVNLTVVIYSGRALDEPATGEAGLNVYLNPSTPVINVTWNPSLGQVAPDIRMGTWLLDAGMAPTPRGQFHRVVSVTQTGPTSMDVELLSPPSYAGNSLIIVMENVVEVYFRGDI